MFSHTLKERAMSKKEPSFTEMLLLLRVLQYELEMGHYETLGSKSFLQLDFCLLTWPLLYHNKLTNWMDCLLQCQDTSVWASQSHREDSRESLWYNNFSKAQFL